MRQREEGADDEVAEQQVEKQLTVRPPGALGWPTQISGGRTFDECPQLAAYPLQLLMNGSAGGLRTHGLIVTRVRSPLPVDRNQRSATREVAGPCSTAAIRL